jgi:hypothetical protein
MSVDLKIQSGRGRLDGIIVNTHLILVLVWLPFRPCLSPSLSLSPTDMCWKNASLHPIELTFSRQSTWLACVWVPISVFCGYELCTCTIHFDMRLHLYCVYCTQACTHLHPHTRTHTAHIIVTSVSLSLFVLTLMVKHLSFKHCL